MSILKRKAEIAHRGLNNDQLMVDLWSRVVVTYPTVAALLSDRSLAYMRGPSPVSVGDLILVLDGMALFEVAEEGADDYHRITYYELVKLYEAGIRYTTRDRFVSAVARGLSLFDGVEVRAAGLGYIATSGSTEIPDLPGFVPAPYYLPDFAGDVTDWHAITGTGIVSGIDASNAPTPSGRYHGFFSSVTPTNQFNLAIHRDNGRAFWAKRTGGWDGWKLLGASQTPIARAVAGNDASIDFILPDDGYYQSYLFVLNNLIPSVDDAALLLRSSANGGLSYDEGSHYAWTMNTTRPAGNTVNAANLNGAIQLTSSSPGLGVGNDVGEEGYSGSLVIHNPADSKQTYVNFDSAYSSAGQGFLVNKGGGKRLLAATVNAVRFLFSTGNVQSGSIYMYGYCEDT